MSLQAFAGNALQAAMFADNGEALCRPVLRAGLTINRGQSAVFAKFGNNDNQAYLKGLSTVQLLQNWIQSG